jgi:uncharacterized repeat protein (TIGR03803 family)
MRHKITFRIILGTLATVVVTLILSSSAGAQSTFKTLHKFKGGKDGSDLVAGPTFDQAGNLYGNTGYGGVHNNSGTVFKLTPNQNGGWTKRVLHSFGSRRNDGSVPFAGLIFDQAGNLYGTTVGGRRSRLGQRLPTDSEPERKVDRERAV